MGILLRWKKHNFMVKIDILRNYFLKNLGVLRGDFRGIRCPNNSQMPCWLTSCLRMNMTHGLEWHYFFRCCGIWSLLAVACYELRRLNLPSALSLVETWRSARLQRKPPFSRIHLKSFRKSRFRMNNLMTVII